VRRVIVTLRALRPLAAVAALAVLLGTSCVHTRSLRVQPGAGTATAPAPDVLLDSVHATMSGFVLARGYLLPDSARHRADGLVEWCAFSARNGPAVCWSRFADGVAVEISQRGGGGFGAYADSLRRDIAALLSGRFGEDAVRPCRWHVEVDHARSRWWSTKTRSECIVKEDASTRPGR
jgi:hypothetical protein